MRSSQKTFRAIAVDNQVASVADDEIIALKPDEEFG
jgi:hypothetical protein